jgi:hypothetical protein
MNRQSQKTTKQNSKRGVTAQKLKLPLMTKSITTVPDRALPQPMQRRAIRQRAAIGYGLAKTESLRSSSAPEAFYYDTLNDSKKGKSASAWADDSACTDKSRSSTASKYGQKFCKERQPTCVAAKFEPLIGAGSHVEAELNCPKSISAELTSPNGNLPSNEQSEQLPSLGVISDGLPLSGGSSIFVIDSVHETEGRVVQDRRTKSDAQEGELTWWQAPNAIINSETVEAEGLEKENVRSSEPRNDACAEVASGSIIESSDGAITISSPPGKRNARPSLFGAVHKIVEENRSDAPVLTAQEQIDEVSEDEETNQGMGDVAHGKSTTKITGLASAVTAAVAAERAKERKALLDTLDKTQLCRDISGRRHVIKELRQQRYKAVMRGMNWLEKFLKSDGHAALYAIGDDAPSVFFEIWYTSADSRIRCRARGIAEALIEKYEASLLAGNQSPDDQGGEQFFECMFLLRCKHEMGLDTSGLLARADMLYKREGLRDTSKLFGVDVADLKDVPVADWLLLLMRVMCLEYNNLLHRKRWPLKWGLRECFSALRCVPLQPPPAECNIDDTAMGEAFHHAFYLATHIVYAIGAYSVVKTSEKEVPWLYKYCRESLKFWMKRAKAKAKAGGHDTAEGREIYVDVDGVAE